MRRLYRACLFSFAGLRDAWNEPAARLEIVGIAIAIPLALWLPVTGLERVVLVASALLVLAVELLNTAIERTVDRIGLDRHELSRRAKDLGSAAVLVATSIAAVSWIGIAGPHLLAWAGALAASAR
jgi:diacylglycerol kinase (ATP)